MKTVTAQADRAASPLGADEPRMVAVSRVDCDVHPVSVDPNEIGQFLPERWRYLQKGWAKLPYRGDVINDGRRIDSDPRLYGLEGVSGSNPKVVYEQLLREARIDFAILIYHTTPVLPNADADAARCSAINQFLADIWLGDEYDPLHRYRGSIRLPMQNPTAALRELERWGDDPRFVQALAVNGYSPAFGHAMYEPIWRALAERNMPVAMHASTEPLAQMTPVGPPTYFFEWHALVYPHAYAAHVASLVCNGVFERNPQLKLVLVEGGISWSSALSCHLDNNWRHLRAEVPDLSLAPSEYIRRSVLFTTQPVEEPSEPTALLAMYQAIGAEKRVMFSTDYPHWDYDDPEHALPRMPTDLKRAIMFETACELYGLPRERPADAFD